ncbi:hypothetical protein H5410_041116 [Solanum commersonii]|uniref:Uncharacterized protein n=1 Tax=Solanum commersonii TaxID=4109 RepID=A0A9J5XS40_SOLCO|nr:hypothetical protein H5410_041116 [Solanum commersonii]
MAPKENNVAGSKWSRKGEASGSGNREPAKKFEKKAVKEYGLLWFDCQWEPKYMGDEYVDKIRLQTQFLAIYRTVLELGLEFIFYHLGDCNLTLGVVTRYLRAQGTEEEACDLTIAFRPDLMERQARDDSVMARMFGMAELQLRIGGCPATDAKMETMAERYPFSESATFLCKTGHAFLETLDDDEATNDEEEDDVTPRLGVLRGASHQLT